MRRTGCDGTTRVSLEEAWQGGPRGWFKITYVSMIRNIMVYVFLFLRTYFLK